MKRLVWLILIALLLCACASAETTRATAYRAVGTQWGPEPKENFDIGVFLSDPDAAENVDCGFDGERAYRVSESNLDPGEFLAFRMETLEYNTAGGQALHSMTTYPHTPVAEAPDDLTREAALAVLQPYLEATGLAIGAPHRVEAWTDAEVSAHMAQYGTQDDIARAEAIGGFLLIECPVIIDDIPGGTFHDGGNGVSIQPMGVMAIISRHGLEFFRATPFFSQMIPQGEAQPVIAPEAARATLDKAGVLSEDIRNVGEPTLCYLAYRMGAYAECAFDLIPAWVVAAERHIEGFAIPKYYAVNALTGECLPSDALPRP